MPIQLEKGNKDGFFFSVLLNEELEYPVGLTALGLMRDVFIINFSDSF